MPISNYYRNDGWVKDVRGPAIPGAQIYVCTQPANVTPPVTPPRTTPVPWQGPNPQAQIFSDAGFTPIVQPIISDGFGHYDFYALPGLYTVVIMFGGKVQQVYVDQSLGNIGTSTGSSVLFSTNGSPNFNQLAQNLVQGAGVTIATDNFGNTVITGTGAVLKTNGVANGNQALLNLKDGVGIAVTQDGLGNTTVTNTAPQSTLPSGTNGPFFIGPGFLSVNIPQMVRGGLTGGLADAIRVGRFVLPFSMTVSKCSIFASFASALAVCSFAIYSADGSTKVLDSGTFNVPGGFSAYTWFTNTFSPVVIPAGVYYTAQTDAVAGGGWVVQCVDVTDASFGLNVYPGARNLMGRSSTLSSGGALPASIDVSSLIFDSDVSSALPIWESQ